jgi:hypothetical protein
MKYLKIYLISLIIGIIAGVFIWVLPVGACTTVTPTPTPEITPTPEVTPRVTPTPVPYQPAWPQPCNGCTGTPVAPTCADSSTILLPANFFVERAGKDAILKWWPTQGSQVNVFYKEVGQSGWTYGVGDLPNNGEYTVHALNPGVGYTFGLVQKTGCGGGQLATAVVVDGPQHKLFSMSYWEWLK